MLSAEGSATLALRGPRVVVVAVARFTSADYFQALVSKGTPEAVAAGVVKGLLQMKGQGK